MKRLLTLAMASAMLLLCACGGGSSNGGDSSGTPPGAGGDTVYELRLATDVVPENFMVKKINECVEEVKEKTDGHVNITVYPGGQLGSYTAVHSQLITGDIDMAMNFIDPNYDNRLYAGIFPALVEGYDGFKESMLDKEGYMWSLFTDIEDGMNLEFLGIYNSGLMGIGTVKKPGDNFSDCVDPDVSKDLLIRIPSMDNYLAVISHMGYKTTTIAYSDLYPALQSGVADGWMGGTPVNNWDSFRDVIKYFVDARLNSEPLPIVICKDSMAKLPAEYQEVIREVFYESCFDIADEVEQESEKALQHMTDYGITIIQGTDEEYKALYAEQRAALWPDLQNLVGEDVFNALVKEFNVEF